MIGWVYGATLGALSSLFTKACDCMSSVTTAWGRRVETSGWPGRATTYAA